MAWMCDALCCAAREKIKCPSNITVYTITDHLWGLFLHLGSSESSEVNNPKRGFKCRVRVRGMFHTLTYSVSELGKNFQKLSDIKERQLTATWQKTCCVCVCVGFKYTSTSDKTHSLSGAVTALIIPSTDPSGRKEWVLVCVCDSLTAEMNKREGRRQRRS